MFNKEDYKFVCRFNSPDLMEVYYPDLSEEEILSLFEGTNDFVEYKGVRVPLGLDLEKSLIVIFDFEVSEEFAEDLAVALRQSSYNSYVEGKDYVGIENGMIYAYEVYAL